MTPLRLVALSVAMLVSTVGGVRAQTATLGPLEADARRAEALRHGASDIPALTLAAQQAQRPRPAPRPAPPPGPAFTIRGLVDIGYVSFSASESMEAVYGARGGLLWGGGVQVAHRSGLFGRVTAFQYKADGERVFVSGGEVFPLGIPTTLTVVPVDVTAGWRFVPRRRATPVPLGRRPPRQWNLVPYIGAGIGVLRVTEKGDFAASGEDVERSESSYHLLGGVEVPITGWLGSGVEVTWRRAPDVLAGTGIAEEFRETSLDHVSFAVRFTIGK